MCYFWPGFDIILTKKTHFLTQMFICENTNFRGGGGGGLGDATGIGIVIEKNENMIVPIPADKFHGFIAGSWL